MHIITIILIGLLLVIVVCDFKHLTIPLYVLLLTIMTAIIRLLLLNTLIPALSIAWINLLGCSAIILFAFLTLFLLRRKLFNPFKSHIGIGDIVFFPVLCFSFSPFNFIIFFVLALAIVLVLKPLLFRNKHEFPLAGGISALLAVILILSEIMTFNLYSDNAVINFIIVQ